MSKDPRDGLKLRLGYEIAKEIQRTRIIALGVIDQATKAINSVLYQRLQDQIIDDNPTARILEERVRDINITNIASENNINKQDRVPGPTWRQGATWRQRRSRSSWSSGSIFWTIGRIWKAIEAWSIRGSSFYG